MYSYVKFNNHIPFLRGVSILIQVVNVFLFTVNGERVKETSLNPYSGGKCIPIETQIVYICMIRLKSQSLFRW